jgi:hypothetical protein
VSDYGLDDRAIEFRSPGEAWNFPPNLFPDRLWGPHSLLSDGYRWSFPLELKRGQGVFISFAPRWLVLYSKMDVAHYPDNIAHTVPPLDQYPEVLHSSRCWISISTTVETRWFLLLKREWNWCLSLLVKKCWIVIIQTKQFVCNWYPSYINISVCACRKLQIHTLQLIAYYNKQWEIKHSSNEAVIINIYSSNPMTFHGLNQCLNANGVYYLETD